MNIEVQSCSVDVPGTCPNKCKCCVSSMHINKKFMQDRVTPLKGDLSNEAEHLAMFNEYRDRLAYVREKTDTCVLTGTDSEPALNKAFLEFFHKVNRSLPAPFYNVEIQSSGVGLDQKKMELLKKIGVKTLAISVFSLDSVLNNQIQQTPPKLTYNIPDLCTSITAEGFNLRVCFNLNKEGFPDCIDHNDLINSMIACAKNWGANQITFRKLYHNDDNSCPETRWVIENQLDEDFYKSVTDYIETNGRYKRTLSFGAKLYTINGMSIIVDPDCMATRNKENSTKITRESLKFLILRRNIKLYSDWEDEGSLIF